MAPCLGNRTMNIRLVSLVAALGLVAAASANGASAPGITEAELVSRTQEMLDGVTAGDPKPFQHWFADDALIHDEKGNSFTKKALVAEVTPPPADFAGSLKIVHPESRILGDTAVLSYDLEESETLAGQTVYARYHTTDTWVRRDGEWRIVAQQALRYYADPAAAPADPARYPDYVGTYQMGSRVREVVSQGDRLVMQPKGKTTGTALSREAPDLFFRPGVEGRILFHRGASGAVDALVDRRNNQDLVWKRVG